MENDLDMQKEDYFLLDHIKLVCAFLVIGIHTRPLMAIGDVLDKVFYYDISNYAVPFFYACTGYLLIIQQTNASWQNRIKKRIYKVTKAYLIWTVAYLPLTIYGWIISGHGLFYNILNFFRNLLFIGENYYSWTLWYLNGLIAALLVIKCFSKRLSIKRIFLVASVLYLVGIVLDMVRDHTDFIPTILAVPTKIYFAFFSTTRNGVFQSLIFISIGMVIAEKVQKKERLFTIKSFVCAVGIYTVKVALSLMRGGVYLSRICDLPTFWFMFEGIIWCCTREIKSSLHSGEEWKKTAKMSRLLSSYVYYVHMYFVALCALVLMGEDNYHNFLSFEIVSLGATVVGLIIICIKMNMPRRNKIGKISSQ